MVASPKLSDKVILGTTAQGSILVGIALITGHDGWLLTCWLAGLASIAGVTGGYFIGKRKT
jgi:hypothetical protein